VSECHPIGLIIIRGWLAGWLVAGWLVGVKANNGGTQQSPIIVLINARCQNGFS